MSRYRSDAPCKRTVSGSNPLTGSTNFAAISSLTCINAGREIITMTRSASVRVKIPTESPQPFRKGAARAAGRPKAAISPAVLVGSTERVATRGDGEVIEFECGITVYPARSEGGRWRAVWHQDGEWRQCEAATEEKLAPCCLVKLGEPRRIDVHVPLTLQGNDPLTRASGFRRGIGEYALTARRR